MFITTPNHVEIEGPILERLSHYILNEGLGTTLNIIVLSVIWYFISL